jgi:hypothetical protein
VNPGDIVSVAGDTRPWRIVVIFDAIAVLECAGEAWVREREVPVAALRPYVEPTWNPAEVLRRFGT